MPESLLLLILVAVLAGRLAIVGLRQRELRRKAERRIADDEILATLLLGTLEMKAKEPYWSCQSTTRARVIAADLIANAQKAAESACEALPREFNRSIKMERLARAKLSAAMHTLWLAEGELVPLIDRMRQAVDGCHEQVTELQRLLAELAERRAAEGRPADEAAARIEGVGAALAKHCGPNIAAAPVTTLRTINALVHTLNLELRSLLAGPAEPEKKG